MEQARKFQGYGAIDQIVDSRTTSPQALAELMAAVLTGSPTARTPLDCAGAGATAELLQAELQRRSSVRLAEESWAGRDAPSSGWRDAEGSMTRGPARRPIRRTLARRCSPMGGGAA